MQAAARFLHNLDRVDGGQELIPHQSGWALTRLTVWADENDLHILVQSGAA